MLIASGIDCRLRVRLRRRGGESHAEIIHQEPVVATSTDAQSGATITTVTAIIKLDSESLKKFKRRNYFMDWNKLPDVEPESYWCKLVSSFYNPKTKKMEEIVETETWMSKSHPESQHRSTESYSNRNNGKLPLPRLNFPSNELGTLRLELHAVPEGFELVHSDTQTEDLIFEQNDYPSIVFVFGFVYDPEVEYGPDSCFLPLLNFTSDISISVPSTPSQSRPSSGLSKISRSTSGTIPPEPVSDYDSDTGSGVGVGIAHQTRSRSTKSPMKIPPKPIVVVKKRVSKQKQKQKQLQGSSTALPYSSNVLGSISASASASAPVFDSCPEGTAAAINAAYGQAQEGSTIPNPVASAEVENERPTKKTRNECASVAEEGASYDTTSAVQIMDEAEIALKRAKDEGARLDAELRVFTEKRTRELQEQTQKIEEENERKKRKLLEYCHGQGESA